MPLRSWEQGVTEVGEFPDTGTVIAALNVALISHQSQSPEAPTRKYCLMCNLLLSAIQLPI